MKKVITYGTYDLFHEGHYRLLKRAKELGDYLIVGITTEHFDECRGKLNVVDPIVKRIENVKNTGFADMIIVEDHEGQKIEDIQKYGVDIFTVGSDWIGTFDYLNAFCKVVYLERTPNISSTMLRGSAYKIIKIGIVGTGRIAGRFVSEARFASGIAVSEAYNPEIESTASIPELTIVLPHFCANPLMEEITPLEDLPSFNIIKSIVSFTNTLTNAFCIDAVQAEINVSTHKNTKFVFPVKNKITYNTIDNACDTSNAFCPVLNTFKKIGINTTIEINAPIEITPMYTEMRSGLAQ